MGDASVAVSSSETIYAVSIGKKEAKGISFKDETTKSWTVNNRTEIKNNSGNIIGYTGTLYIGDKNTEITVQSGYYPIKKILMAYGNPKNTGKKKRN